MGVAQRGNPVLRTLLSQLAWSPSLLADAVNGLLGPGHVARSTVSDWLHHDRLPRNPLPTVVAHVLSDALGWEVGVAVRTTISPDTVIFLSGGLGLREQLIPDGGICVHPLPVGDAATPKRLPARWPHASMS